MRHAQKNLAQDVPADAFFLAFALYNNSSVLYTTAYNSGLPELLPTIATHTQQQQQQFRSFSIPVLKYSRSNCIPPVRNQIPHPDMMMVAHCMMVQSYYRVKAYICILLYGIYSRFGCYLRPSGRICTSRRSVGVCAVGSPGQFVRSSGALTGMAVDHGLGGKDNKKSQQRREKKAKRTKAIAIKALHSGTKKKEVVFNEVARTEWLTGFHKRKQERRKYGLAMQVMKDKKSHKDTVKEQRSLIKASSALALKELEERTAKEADSDDGYDYDYADAVEEGGGEGQAERGEEKSHELLFGDSATTSMFGGAVSVVIDTGVADDLFEQNNPDLESGLPAQSRGFGKKKALTNFEKAMKVVNRRGLNNRKSKTGGGDKKGGKHFEKATDDRKGGKTKKHTGKLLFHKALGSGALGSNTYKVGRLRQTPANPLCSSMLSPL